MRIRNLTDAGQQVETRLAPNPVSRLGFTHGYTRAQSVTHTHTHTRTHTVSLSLSLSHTHTVTQYLSLSLSLSHTHTHTNTHRLPNKGVDGVEGSLSLEEPGLAKGCQYGM